MLNRFDAKMLLSIALALPIAGCGNALVDSIQVTPTTQSAAIGQTAQFTATGITSHGSHPSSTQNLTDQVTWASSEPSVATVNASGVAIGLSAGTTTITASMSGFKGAVTAAASLAVTSTSATASGEPLASIVILPSSLTTDNLEGTGQFLAYGTFSTAPTLMDITNGFSHPGFPAGCTQSCPTVAVNWISAAPEVFPINSSGAAGATAGLVTAEGSGNADIYVTATNPDGTLVYSPSVTFNCPLAVPTYNSSGAMTNPGTCNQYTIATGLLVTLTVYNAGSNTAGWLVTAPSATGTPDVIDCGPGSTSGSVCEATYPVGTTVTLTAPAKTGVAFGGWSWNCEAQGTISATGPNSCTVYLGAVDPHTGAPSSNVTVGAIFNNQ